MMPPLLLDTYASPVAFGATAGIYTAVPVDLPTLAQVRERRAQLAPCPTCDEPLPGLLAACWKPDCLTAAIAEDAAFTEPEPDE